MFPAVRVFSQGKASAGRAKSASGRRCGLFSVKRGHRAEAMINAVLSFIPASGKGGWIQCHAVDRGLFAGVFGIGSD